MAIRDEINQRNFTRLINELWNLTVDKAIPEKLDNYDNLLEFDGGVFYENWGQSSPIIAKCRQFLCYLTNGKIFPHRQEMMRRRIPQRYFDELLTQRFVNKLVNEVQQANKLLRIPENRHVDVTLLCNIMAKCEGFHGSLSVIQQRANTQSKIVKDGGYFGYNPDQLIDKWLKVLKYPIGMHHAHQQEAIMTMIALMCSNVENQNDYVFRTRHNINGEEDIQLLDRQGQVIHRYDAKSVGAELSPTQVRAGAMKLDLIHREYTQNIFWRRNDIYVRLQGTTNHKNINKKWGLPELCPLAQDFPVNYEFVQPRQTEILLRVSNVPEEKLPVKTPKVRVTDDQKEYERPSKKAKSSFKAGLGAAIASGNDPFASSRNYSGRTLNIKKRRRHQTSNFTHHRKKAATKKWLDSKKPKPKYYPLYKNQWKNFTKNNPDEDAWLYKFFEKAVNEVNSDVIDFEPYSPALDIDMNATGTPTRTSDGNTIPPQLLRDPQFLPIETRENVINTRANADTTGRRSLQYD